MAPPPPVMWLIAGPNGSGKSTLTASPLFLALLRTPEHPDTPLIINPDRIAAVLAAGGVRNATLEAAREADRRMDDFIQRRHSFGRETVLSTDRLLEKIDGARRRGFRIALTYLILESPELNIARVAQRVAQGGHDVPAEKVRSRWFGSLAMLPRFSALSDTVVLLDNSYLDGRPALLSTFSGAGLWVDAKAIARLSSTPHPKELGMALSAMIAELSDR